MNKFKCFLLCALSVMPLVGCTHKNSIGECNPQQMECPDVLAKDRTAPLFTKPSPIAEKHDYGALVGRKIYSQLSDPRQFVGKSCVITISLLENGKLKGLHTAYPAGSKDYCQALQAIAKKMTYPQPPTGALSASGELMPLEFNEYQP
ncbi:cell envelope integrity protein TolA [Salmonella enterica]|nr:cell envelope integrity protein TolA [Salmonella enterica]EFR2649745.1 cell envelope integrity protein TolA [Salmonella enterica]EFS1408052.1 cell envelope integrity protein TolA [Salmonella enterica]EHQ8162542.1 cell envelope integrity protein TolA [Salmonella enterica]EJZ9218195.1 cell envelope integrity protein TolA [Salmonella enterica]